MDLDGLRPRSCAVHLGTEKAYRCQRIVAMARFRHRRPYAAPAVTGVVNLLRQNLIHWPTVTGRHRELAGAVIWRDLLAFVGVVALLRQQRC